MMKGDANHNLLCLLQLILAILFHFYSKYCHGRALQILGVLRLLKVSFIRLSQFHLFYMSYKADFCKNLT